MAARLREGLRRAIGLIAAYALVLQATFAGALVHPTTADAAFDPLSAICVIDGGKAHAGMPDTPSNSGGGHHAGHDCGLCAFAAPAVALAIAVVLEQLTPDRGIPLLAAADQVACPGAHAHPGRARAPPIA